MFLREAEKLSIRLKREGYDAKVTRDYSGRFMFGHKTIGVVTDAHHSFCPFLRDWNFDSMGRDFIYY